ncbi:NAD(P)H-dependent oxidoreductase [Acaryochloris sp. 'Moss Beach']|uniref:FMN-dependent NADH-azoreductase n=1 Tax=Acaryochloris sp. 'Moss Beach' TaxID=2740837 RepID=UPI001F1BABBA|nr:NAD(P)H-dependent oxidoreductase [Acaryochloris sp. 'Moss Beach']UJB68927.1 NAD(P)H-dependent oxidoreductase [Acaryochloris sp. 'Moss Beach']
MISPDSKPRCLLHMDVSARIQDSYSRQLTQAFVSQWQQANPNCHIIYRDIGSSPIPHINEGWVAAYESEPEQRTAEMQGAIAFSDTLIDELFAADCYVVGMPMYNLTVPSSFKAYLDQVFRRDRTLQIVNGTPQGRLVDKKLLVITTRKYNYRVGSGREDRDFLEPYISAIFKVLGLTDISYIHADQLALELERKQSLANATKAIHQLALTF